MTGHTLGTVYAIFTMATALGALWVMQMVTPDAGIRDSVAVIKLGHRFVLGLVSVVLLAAGADTLYYDTAPRPIDFLVQSVLVAVLALSATRHLLVRKAQFSHDFPLHHA